MKKVIYVLLLFFLSLSGLVQSQEIAPSLSLHLHGKDYSSLSRPKEINFGLGLGYSFNENKVSLNKQRRPDSGIENTNNYSPSIKRENFISGRKLFLGLNYEYNQSGSQGLSFLNKKRDTGESKFTIDVTPKEISAVVRLSF